MQHKTNSWRDCRKTNFDRKAISALKTILAAEKLLVKLQLRQRNSWIIKIIAVTEIILVRLKNISCHRETAP